jgi:hypothetical protein
MAGDAAAHAVTTVADAMHVADAQTGELHMGLFRKTTSLMTLGAVDFRSDKERTAAYTKAVRKEAKEQTRLMRLQALQQVAQRHTPEAQPPVPQPPAPQLPPAGWYPDREDAAIVRWFDGTQWTDFTQPRG